MCKKGCPNEGKLFLIYAHRLEKLYLNPKEQ